MPGTNKLHPPGKPKLLAQRATLGHVAGIEPSAVMVGQASKRNAAAISAGQADLRLGSVEALPFADKQFNKVLSVNNIMLWPGPDESVREVYRVMKPGGLLGVALNPRWAKTADDVQAMGGEIMHHVMSAGFVQVSVELRPDLKPAGAVVVTAYAKGP